jgi:hypothetical protein
LNSIITKVKGEAEPTPLPFFLFGHIFNDCLSGVTVVDKTEITEQLRNTSTMSLELGEEQLATLFLLLQNGFFIEACVGCSIKDFFSERLGLSPEYIQKRIQGIFLDGKPADHIETAIIRDGARLTISGTMPGLAGMALKSGPLAVFRHGITHGFKERPTCRLPPRHHPSGNRRL